jgi:hypothetical protein
MTIDETAAGVLHALFDGLLLTERATFDANALFGTVDLEDGSLFASHVPGDDDDFVALLDLELSH